MSAERFDPFCQYPNPTGKDRLVFLVILLGVIYMILHFGA